MSDSMIRNLFALGYGLLAGAVVFLVSHVPHLSPHWPEDESSAYLPAEWPPEVDTTVQEDLDGAGLYAANCQACHQADGGGTPGAFPPLAGSEWVTGDPETPIRIVLRGVSGPIDVKGTQYNSAMPQLPLDAEQIAKILTHVRSSFGNSASEVTPEMVEGVQESIGDRTDAWTAEELNALR